MELVDRAISHNNLRIRSIFPWSGISHAASNWTVKIPFSEDPESEYYFAKSIIQHRWGNIMQHRLNKNMTIKRVENPYLWARYVLSYEELRVAKRNLRVDEEIVVHVTSSENAKKIADENFNWRKAKNSLFGNGINFCDVAQWAWNSATYKDVFIIAGIPIGQYSVGNGMMKIPPDGCDTTFSYNAYVVTKYHDDNYYPYYIIENVVNNEKTGFSVPW